MKGRLNHLRSCHWLQAYWSLLHSWLMLACVQCYSITKTNSVIVTSSLHTQFDRTHELMMKWWLVNPSDMGPLAIGGPCPLTLLALPLAWPSWSNIACSLVHYLIFFISVGSDVLESLFLWSNLMLKRARQPFCADLTTIYFRYIIVIFLLLSVQNSCFRYKLRYQFNFMLNN